MGHIIKPQLLKHRDYTHDAVNECNRLWVLKNSVIKSPLGCGEVAASLSFLPRFNW